MRVLLEIMALASSVGACLCKVFGTGGKQRRLALVELLVVLVIALIYAVVRYW